MLLNWRDHSWLHLFVADKAMRSSAAVSPYCERGLNHIPGVYPPLMLRSRLPFQTNITGLKLNYQCIPSLMLFRMCFDVHCGMFIACDAPVVISCQLILRVEKSFSTEHLLAKKLALFYSCSHLLRPNHSPLAESLVWKSYFFLCGTAAIHQKLRACWFAC